MKQAALFLNEMLCIREVFLNFVKSQIFCQVDDCMHALHRARLPSAVYCI